MYLSSLKLNGIKGLALLIALCAFFSCSRQKNLQDPIRKMNFSEIEHAMIMSSDSSSPMRVFKISDRKDSLLLREKSTDVTLSFKDPTLDHFISRLYKTVRDSMSLGVGIAAAQVGILKNIIWVQRFDKEDFPFEVYINPKIKQYSKKLMTRREGCLSIPDRSDTLNCRSYAILIEYDKRDKSHHVEMVEDFTAIIFQHEIDHLNGILYIDHLEKEFNAGQ